MPLKIYLFPSWIKLPGFLLMLGGAFFAYLYFWGERPEFFNIKVFAIVSAYLETRYFVIAQTNILDELAAILFLTGIVAFSFSKLKTEKPEYTLLRVKALFYSVFIISVFEILSFLLIYGMAIFLLTSGTFIFYLITYNILFYYFIFKNKHKNAVSSK